MVKQERFVMTADPPEPEPAMVNYLLTLNLRADLDELFYEPENYTEPIEEDYNATTTPVPPATTRRTTTKTPKPAPPKWVIPVTFSVGPIDDYDEDMENITRGWKNATENLQNGTW
ncbi:hypothetical protein O3G_MSEX014095 [Manduca sexta]|uniref:Uncharacterized protein n=2 Tax=Manduca sexta TaxID=7130 RepID=A0A921ZVU6_MANSE|nr:hypothetical protein O3G_MSEX014095 [Manduca sexta]